MMAWMYAENDTPQESFSSVVYDCVNKYNDRSTRAKCNLKDQKRSFWFDELSCGLTVGRSTFFEL
jgi:hypothetical protein